MDSYADLLNLNFMYSLRTGNLVTDMMIAALLPLVSGAVAYVTRSWWPQLVNRLLSYFSNVDCTSVTFRTSEETPSIYYGFTLRIALSKYVTTVLQPRYDVAELKYVSIPGKKLHEASSYTEALRDFCFVDAGPAKEVPMELLPDLELKQMDAGEGNDGESKDKESGGSKDKKTTRDLVFTLVQYRPSFPVLQKLRWSKEDTARPDATAEAAKELAELEQKMKTNDDAIQFVLDRALAHYREEFKQASVSPDRYLYQPLLTLPKLGFGVSGADEKVGNEGAMDCNRYLLHSEKTFNSLFFPDKPRLLQLIDSFEKKAGKYAIPGYPQKLVLLLYGPPGTGKTSLAKAVAAYTQRDLFAISLSRIRSNEELLKYMFSGRVKVQNEKNNDDNDRYGGNNDGTKELDPTKLVYILEDVDATNAIVLKDEAEAEAEAEAEVAAADDEPSEKNEKASKKNKKHAKKSKTGSTKPPSEEGNIEDEEAAEKDSEEEVPPKKKKSAKKVSSGEKEEEEGDEEDEEAASSGASTEREVVAVKGKHAKHARKLTIEGLTNALNGVLDFPQRIVIMTTNHIERLHPSLLRPGVVTMKLHMHNFDADCAVEMVKHYFSHTTIHSEQLMELQALVEKASAKTSKADTAAASSGDGAAGGNSVSEVKGFSPAELEQRGAECETVDELLEALRQGSRVNIF